MELTTSTEHVPIQAGDVIVFQGDHFVSRVIAYASDWPRCKISHCAIMADIDNNLAEATTLDGENGVAIVGLQYKLDTYEGHMWHLPLRAEARKRLQLDKLATFVWSEVSHPYSKLQAVLAPLRVGQDLHNWADDWYCSKLVAKALVEGSVLSVMFDVAITPSQLTRLNCFGPMRQLK